MRALHSRHPARAVSGLLIAAACLMLAGCELPEPLEPKTPPTEIEGLAPAKPPATAAAPVADAGGGKPPTGKSKSSSPAVIVLTGPTPPLPRWVQAAAVSPARPRSLPMETPTPAALSMTEIAAGSVLSPEAPVPSPVAATPPAKPATSVAEAPAKPIPVDEAAAAATVPESPSPTTPAAIATTATPVPQKAAIATLDPVIQITTPAYFATPPQSSRLPPASPLPLPGLQASETKVAAAAPTERPIDRPAIEAPTAAVATPPAMVRETAPPPVIVAVPQPAQSEAAKIPAATELPATVPPTEAAAPATAAAIVAPQPSLQIHDGRFAGMPLPNLPALAPDGSTATATPVEIAQAESNTAAAAASLSVPASVDGDPAVVALRKASERTGLSDLQQARIEESRQLIAAGNAGLALNLMRDLNAELDAATTTYVVAAGDNLWRIAEKPQVYGNAYLWPVIWRANSGRLKDPAALFKGMRLKVPSNPSVLEVTDAIDYARRNGGENMPPAADSPAAPGTP